MIYVSTDHRLGERPSTENHLYCAHPHEPRLCWHCRRPTRWVELSFETSLCPGPCTDAKWTEYWQAKQVARPTDLREPA